MGYIPDQIWLQKCTFLSYCTITLVYRDPQKCTYQSKTSNATFTYHVIVINVPIRNKPIKGKIYAICTNYVMCINGVMYAKGEIAFINANANQIPYIIQQ